MNTKNVLISGIVGGIAFFLLGWLIYGMLLMNYMMSVSPKIDGLWRTESEFVWWAMIVSNLLSGFLMAFIFDLGKVSGWMKGLTTGAIIGLLMCSAIDTSFYGMSYMMSKQGMMADVLACTIISGIVGAVIAMTMGMLNNKSIA